MTRFAFCISAAILLAGSPVGADDPPAIRWVTVDATHLPEALRRDDLIRMRRDAFEALVARAAGATERASGGPQVVAADYQLRWAEDRFLGTATLVIQRAKHDPPFLRLGPLGGALVGPAMLDGRPAILGEVAGVGLALVSEFLGRSTFTFSWSVRSDRRPEGHWLYLQLPAAPSAELTVLLPAEHWLEFPGNRQLTPVLAAKAPDGWRWRIALGGSEPTEAEALIRPTGDAGRPPLLLARLTSEHEVTPAGVSSRFEFDLDAVHGRWSQLELEADPALEISQATLKQPESKDVLFAQRLDAGRATCVVMLPDGIPGRRLLELRGRAPAPVLKSGAAWSPPWMWAREARSGRELMRIRTTPGLRLADWRFGDFQPTRPWQTERRGSEVWESLHLTQAGLAMGRPAPPAARVQLADGEVAVRQEAWWHIRQERSQFVVRAWWQVLSGRLDRLVMSLPAGWEVDDLELSPAGFLRDRFQDALAPGSPFTIQLREPIDASVPVRLTLRLRPSGGSLALGQRVMLPMPHVAPLGARWVQTQFGITLERGAVLGHPLWTGALRGANALETPPLTSGQLWSSVAAVPDFYVSYFGRAPDGVLELAPAPPRFEVQATTELRVQSEQHVIKYEARLYPRMGAPERATLELESQYEVPWRIAEGSVKLRAVRRLERGPVQRIELEFDRPATGPLVVRGEAALPAGAPLVVPLLRSADDPRFAGRLVIHARLGSEARPAPAPGLTPCDPTTADEANALCYRYGTAPGLVRVTAEAASPMPAIVIGGVLSMRVAPDGVAHCTYRCRLRSPRLEAHSLALPVKATLLATELDGEPLSLASSAGELDVRPRALESRLQITFSVPNRAVGSLLGLRAQMPRWSEGVFVQGCRTIWHVPDGWVPLSNRWARLPGPRPLDALWREPPTWSELTALLFQFSSAEPDWTADWLARAGTEWQRRRTEWGDQSLRQVLLALEAAIAEPRAALVVDRAALAAAGIDLDAPPKSAGVPWEAAGATLVPCREAILLTTRQRLAFDEAAGAAAAEWTYGRYLTEAIVQGHDSSRRFAVLEAMRGMYDRHDASLLANEPGATSWEAPEEADDESEMRCAPVAFVWTSCIIWGVAIALLGRRIAATRRSRVTLAVLGGGTTLIALLWLPQALQPIAWCQLLGLLAALLRSRPALASYPSSVRHTRVAPGAAVASLALLAFVPFLRAGPQSDGDRTVHTVYLLQAPAEREAGDLLAPRTLVIRLEALARNAAALEPAVVLLSADYRGQVVDNDALFDVTYDLHQLRDEECDVPLPVRNVRLISAHLDGTPANATPSVRGDGFVVRVAGRGRHRLLLRWATPVVANEAEREVRCDVPPVTNSGLHIEVAASVRALRAGNVKGGQATRTLPRSQTLTAALGRTSELRVNWRTDAQADTALRVREAYAWDLDASRCRLDAYLEYEVVRGTMDRLEIELPPALSVQSVELRPQNPLAPPPQLADWRITGRRLELRLAAPVTGRVGVLLNLPFEPSQATPRARLGSLVGAAAGAAVRATDGRPAAVQLLLLAAPIPLGAERQEGLVGWVGDISVAAVVQPERGWTAIPAAERARVWPTVLAAAGMPVQLFRFQRGATANVWARIPASTPEFQSAIDVTLALDALDVEVQADLRVQVQRGELVYLSLRTPPELDLMSVSGEQVLRHTQLDGHVQIWFRNPVQSEAAVHLRGWMRTASEPGRGPRLNLPRLEIVGATSTTARLTIRSRRDLDVRWEQQEGLQAQAGPFAPDTLGVWAATTPGYAGQLRLHQRPRANAAATPPAGPPTAAPRAALATRVLRADYTLQLLSMTQAVCTARYVVLHGPGATLTLEPPEGARLLGAVMAGTPVALQQNETHWKLLLPGVSGLRCIDVTWELSSDGNGPPAFAAPRLPVQPLDAGDLAVTLPPGLTWTQPSGVGGRRAEAEHRLRRSETLVHGVEELVNDRAGLEARWNAQMRAELADIDAEVDAIERNQDLLGGGSVARVGQLRRALNQLGRAAGIDLRLPRSRDAGMRFGAGSCALTGGVATVWIPLDDTPSRIELSVAPGDAARMRRAAWLSLFLALLMVALLPVLHSDQALESVKRSWPEVAVLAGFAWWLAFPGWLIGLAILASGIGGRLGRTIKQFFAPQHPELQPATVVNAAPAPPPSGG